MSPWEIVIMAWLFVSLVLIPLARLWAGRDKDVSEP